MTRFPSEGWAPGAGPTDAYTRYEELRITRIRRDGHGTVIAEDRVDTWHRAIPTIKGSLPIGTMIKFPSHGADDPSTFHFHTPHGWAMSTKAGLRLNAVGWEPIGAYEVVSEPRTATAKAVLDRIAAEPWAREVDLAKWRTEFGVES